MGQEEIIMEIGKSLDLNENTTHQMKMIHFKTCGCSKVKANIQRENMALSNYLRRDMSQLPNLRVISVK